MSGLYPSLEDMTVGKMVKVRWQIMEGAIIFYLFLFFIGPSITAAPDKATDNVGRYPATCSCSSGHWRRRTVPQLGRLHGTRSPALHTRKYTQTSAYTTRDTCIAITIMERHVCINAIGSSGKTLSKRARGTFS